MALSAHDRLNDPFYANLVFHLEGLIHVHDCQAARQGITLTDANIKSSLTKFMQRLKGEQPTIPADKPKDKLLASMITELEKLQQVLLGAFENDQGEEIQAPLPAQYWVNAAEALLESLKTRQAPVPGSRFYLDYVGEFIEEAHARGESKDSQP